jgi:hypothetical protein
MLAVQTLLDVSTLTMANVETQGDRAGDGGPAANGEPQQQVLPNRGGVGGEVEVARLRQASWWWIRQQGWRRWTSWQVARQWR